MKKEKGDKKEEKVKEKDNELNRLIAVGDIHGDYEHFISILQHANLIDEDNNWIGTDAILVQVGDIVDRGNDTFKIFDTIIKLKEQAKEKGGIIYILIGNHEMIELQGNHYYTTTYDYELFGGLEGFEEAIGPAGKYGQFMRQEMNVTMVVDDSLFVHAGIVPEYLTEGVDVINEHAREILLDTPTIEGIHQLYLQNVTHPILTDPLFDLFNRLNPLWNREYANDPEEVVCPKVEKALELTNTKRMIIGHTVQPYGKIRTRCNNKIILIDIGISRCIGGGYYGYLEILKDKQEVWARYLGRN
ncbi:Metallo-dependent phosphatase [Anaeromyces robustus]|uniref:Metallo-dependent phosphatase n=1 Tax=Anaeromyces robustus TaxID=1754192 RepID=A0A1Y1X1G6_9FUNG|nr:Metallo-dependent phosphatase [Anaeromyces robustus]|eukprot:ORX79174.1 Metallo-dependent phosphatase [Anaeromyces robustus]